MEETLKPKYIKRIAAGFRRDSFVTKNIPKQRYYTDGGTACK
jgi:hypothetical protein